MRRTCGAPSGPISPRSGWSSCLHNGPQSRAPMQLRSSTGRRPRGVAGVEVVGTGEESADDWIVHRAAELREPYLLVTSDRELRQRAGGRAEEILGGGAFARQLVAFG